MSEFQGWGADEHHIGLLDRRTDSPICHCGGRTLTSCDASGRPMVISREKGREKWPGLFSCDTCGRLVDGFTREIVRDAE